MLPRIGSDDPEVPVWASYTDIAMNVLVVLVLYLMAQTVYSTLTSAQLLRVRQLQNQMREKVMSSMPEDMRKDVSIAEDGQLMRFQFADRVLFDSGEARLKDRGKEILTRMASALTEESLRTTYSRIQVEGHTDDRPIHTAAFDSNWELSSERATSVVRFLQQKNLDPRILSATGYSQFQPLASDETDQGRQRNRRIEVVVVYTLQGRADQNGAAASRAHTDASEASQ